MSDVVFIRAYVVHRRRHPDYISSCDVCQRAKAFLEAATTMSPDLLDISFIREPNNFGRGKSERKAWKRKMRLLPCHYCKKPGGTIDHRTPTSRGGVDGKKNCVPCCYPCNMMKGDLTEEEFVLSRKTGTITA